MSSSLLSHTRLTMWLGRRGLPDVIQLGHYNYTNAHPALPGHFHPGAMEICFLVKGRQTYRVKGCNYQLRGGDVFLTFPNEEHSTGEEPEEKGMLYWMVLRLPRRGESFLGLPPRLGGGILQGLLEIRSRHFRGSRRMKEDLNSITLLYEQDRTALASAQIANRVQSFLLEVIRCSRRSPSSFQRGSLQPVLDLIAQHPQETYRVPDLAKHSGLSVAHFSARFKEETGVPPAEYMVRSKIKAARRMLEQGHRTVTAIAYDLGFSSSQYFATVFKRLEGLSPRNARLPNRARALPAKTKIRAVERRTTKLSDLLIAEGQPAETNLCAGRRQPR